jgi:Photoprotection regulator fluorescence recovery protein
MPFFPNKDIQAKVYSVGCVLAFQRELISMIEESWSKKEKTVAKRAFKDAYEKECQDLIRQMQKKANEAKEPNDLWPLHNFLRARIKEIENKYDYRYSMLIFLFARLMKEGWITVNEIEGLSEAKIAKIRYLAER